jgi:Tautomerase enzyme
MAQIVVYGHAAVLRPRIPELSDAIHRASVSVLQLPEAKRFHRFLPLEQECFVTPADRSEDYIIIEVSMFEGRSPETIKAFVRELYRQTETLGIAPIDVEVTISTTPRHQWGIRGLPGDELTLDYRVTL